MLREDVARHFRSSVLDRSAAAAYEARYRYHGPANADSAVVRFDLNGYSKWAREQNLVARAGLLNDFFSWVVPVVERFGGVYFRDEGDCIVALFSSYFGLTDSCRPVLDCCKAVISRRYGLEEMSAKALVSTTSLAFYQKVHEFGTDDWSSEGEAFVRAARLEQVVKSQAVIGFFDDEYYQRFAPHGTYASPGGMYYWEGASENIQIQGLGAPGGWHRIHVLTHIPAGRTQK